MTWFWLSICLICVTLLFHYLILDLFFVSSISSCLAFLLDLKVFFRKSFSISYINSIRKSFKACVAFYVLKIVVVFFPIVVRGFIFTFPMFKMGSYMNIFSRYSLYELPIILLLLIWILLVFTSDYYKVWGLIIVSLCSVSIFVILF